MKKKAIVTTVVIAAAAVIVGVAAHHFGKTPTADVAKKAEAKDLTADECKEMMEAAFGNVTEGDVTVESNIMKQTTMMPTADGIVEVPLTDVSQNTVSILRFSGRETRDHWNSNEIMTRDGAEIQNTSAFDDLYFSDRSGAMASYKQDDFGNWIMGQCLDVTTADYLKVLTTAESYTGKQNEDGTYTINSTVAYSDINTIVSYGTTGAYSGEYAELATNTADVVTTFDADKNAVKVEIATDAGEDPADADGDGVIATSAKIAMTFTKNDNIAAELLNDDTYTQVAASIQAQAEAAAAAQAQADLEAQQAAEAEEAAKQQATSFTHTADASESNSSGSSKSNGSSSKSGNSSSNSSGSSKNNSGSSSSNNGSNSGSSDSNTQLQPTITKDQSVIDEANKREEERQKAYDEAIANGTINGSGWTPGNEPDWVKNETAGPMN